MHRVCSRSLKRVWALPVRELVSHPGGERESYRCRRRSPRPQPRHEHATAVPRHRAEAVWGYDLQSRGALPDAPPGVRSRGQRRRRFRERTALGLGGPQLAGSCLWRAGLHPADQAEPQGRTRGLPGRGPLKRQPAGRPFPTARTARSHAPRSRESCILFDLRLHLSSPPGLLGLSRATQVALNLHLGAILEAQLVRAPRTPTGLESFQR